MAKTKVPKKVAGVKVPKALRNSDLVEALIQNETVRRILADALIAAAGAAAAVLTQKVAPSEKVADAGQAVVDTGSKAALATVDLAGGVAGALGHVVADAATSLFPNGTDTGEGKKRRKSRDEEVKA